MIKKLILVVGLLFAFTNANAGTGHSHNASEKRIEMNSKKVISSFIKDKKLPSSWAKAKLLKMKKQNKEWIVTYENKALSEKNRLYIYLSSYGKVLGANFTGK